jgi:hypothetical protein
VADKNFSAGPLHKYMGGFKVEVQKLLHDVA